MENKLIVGIVTTAIAIIVLAGVLIPALDSAEHQQDNKYTNKNPYSLGSIYEFNEDSDETTIISICQTGEHTLSINGVIHNVSTWQPVILSDGFTIRYYANNMSLCTPNGDNTIKTATITINSGVATFSDVVDTNDQSRTINPVDISWAYIHEGTGNYSAFLVESSDVTIYAKKYDIYASNWILTTSEYFSIKNGVVTINDGTDTYETELNWGGEYLDDGVYKLTMNNSTATDYTFVVDNNGSDYTVHPFMVCAPVSVVGTPDDLETINNLFSFIPLFVIIAILLAVAGMIVLKRE